MLYFHECFLLLDLVLLGKLAEFGHFLLELLVPGLDFLLLLGKLDLLAPELLFLGFECLVRFVHLPTLLKQFGV